MQPKLPLMQLWKLVLYTLESVTGNAPWYCAINNVKVIFKISARYRTDWG